MVNAKTIGTGLLITLLLAPGCSYLIVDAGNYLSYDHPFTEAAAEQVQKDAEKLCGQRKQAAVKTRSTCTLERCFTNFQCVNPKDPLEYKAPGFPGNQEF